MKSNVKSRYELGEKLKSCMVCANEVRSQGEMYYGLCENHIKHIIQPPKEIQRFFGRGTEYQLLCHTDELDDVIYQLEFREIDQASDRFSSLIYAHYIAVIFLERLQQCVDLRDFNYITYADGGHAVMDVIFTEMGYLLKDDPASRQILQNQLSVRLKGSESNLELMNKKVLLLDLYRGIETRKSIDWLKLRGASEVVTVYLTSFS